MKKLRVTLLVMALAIFCLACKKNQYDAGKNIDQNALVLKKELSRYMDKLPSSIQMKDRWSEKANAYYTLKADSMKLLRYYVGEDGFNYFYITRLVPSIHLGDRRASAGRFQWDTKDRIKNLEEFFLSNILPEEELDKAADDLFDEAVENKKIEDKNSLKFIEWPNEFFAYDKKTNSWDRQEFIEQRDAIK